MKSLILCDFRHVPGNNSVVIICVYSKTAWFYSRRESSITAFPFCTLCVTLVPDVGYITTGITDVDVDHAASHVGKAQGIVTMLRSVPYNAQRGSCNIPVQSMIEVIFLE